jgi:hypothetical protein
MTRRSRLDSVLRVAELREVQARRDLLAANAARAAAAAAHQQRLSRLSAAETPYGAGDDLRHAVAVRHLRVVAATDAAAEARQADAAGAVAHTGWVDAARRAQLVERLVERQRAEAQADRERAEQRELDDRAGSVRRGWAAAARVSEAAR